MPLDLSIDLDFIAELLGLSLFELQVFLAWLALSLAFGLGAAAVFEVARRWHSPVDRLRRARADDPFAHPFGDMPSMPLPSGSIIDTPSAGLAGRADQGSGGNGNTSRGAAAARPIQGRGRRAY